ncbi:MAG TPA: hypothetical protein V6D00_04820 [Pantanalinema sp.]
MPDDWLAASANRRPPLRVSSPAPSAPASAASNADSKRPADANSYVPAGSPTGFYGHVRDAIRTNRARREVYARASEGASLPLSQKLITLEHLVLPLAAWFDRAASEFNKRGIPVVQADFVPMSGLLPPETPPRHRHRASDEEARRLDGWLTDYRDAAEAAIKGRDFGKVAELSVTLLERIEQLEERSDSHFAMTKHLVESVGFAAVHGVQSHAATHGDADDLIARFLRVQAFGLTGAPSMDREAQRLHERGIGILVNDLPDIPLRAAWAQLQRAAGRE